MAFLLDTNVVSELRRVRPHGAVTEWISRIDDADLFISAVTLGEIQAGIEITRVQDASKADEIEHWLDQLTLSYNILDMTGAAFRIWAKLMHRAPDDLVEDAMIAAIAVANDLTVATRNLKDFDRLGVATVNPFSNVTK